MSLETKIESLTAAITQLIAVMSAQSAPQPTPAAAALAAPPIAQTVIPPTPALPPMPPPPTFAPAPVAAPAPAPTGLPFHDQVGAAAWATAAYQQMAAVNPERAMQGLQGLMQGLQCADMNALTPDKFPVLYQGVQALKAELGIAG